MIYYYYYYYYYFVLYLKRIFNMFRSIMGYLQGESHQVVCIKHGTRFKRKLKIKTRTDFFYKPLYLELHKVEADV